MKYDVIIAGASFAGLSVAGSIEGEILLIDRKEIGSLQTSACGAFLKTMKENGLEESILQTFDTLVLHIPEEKRIKLIEPLCTFDYKQFCQTLAQRIDSIQKIKAVVRGALGNRVITSNGEYEAKCIVDCTGWKAILASSLRKGYGTRAGSMFGIETVADYQAEEMHFYLDSKIIRNGAAWIFPIGKKSRIGLASYDGRPRLLPELKRFLASTGLEIDRVHGNRIPYILREPVVGNIFLVGDSAGQALPVTGEGIRQSLYFGKECGSIIQNIIDGDMPLWKGLQEYKDVVERSKMRYKTILYIQRKLSKNEIPERIRRAANYKIIANLFQKKYLSLP